MDFAAPKVAMEDVGGGAWGCSLKGTAHDLLHRTQECWLGSCSFSEDHK